MKSKIWLYLIAVATFPMLWGCSDDEPTPDYNRLEAEYWGTETPHCFIGQIDSVYIPEQNAAGYIARTDAATGQESILWPGADLQYTVRFTIRLVGKDRIDPVMNRKRYVEICQSLGARPRSKRVNLPEIDDLPQFTIQHAEDKQIINHELERIDLVSYDDLQYPAGKITKAGEQLPDYAHFQAVCFEGLAEQVARCGQDYDIAQELLTSLGFWSSRNIANPNTSLVSTNIKVDIKVNVSNYGDHAFKLIIRFEGMDPIEKDFKLRLGKE